MAKVSSIIADSLKNDTENGKTVGFSFMADLSCARVLAGRGCFLSLVDGFYIAVDGEAFPREAQSVEIHGQPARGMDELKNAVWEHWDATEYARIHVRKEGGLSVGEHKITYMPSILAAYFKAQDSWVTDPPALDAQLRSPTDHADATTICTMREED